MAINIKWNNHQATFLKILKTQREKSKYTDCTLAVDGKFYTVHKNIISSSSEYFSDIFEKTSCKSPVIVLKDVPSHDIEALLDYMYLGEVDVNQNSLSSFLETAKCLKIKGLGVPDEEQTKLPKNSSCCHDDIGQYSSPPKRRRNNSRTMPSQVASPVPLSKNTDTAVISLELTPSTPANVSPNPPNNELSATTLATTAQAPSIQIFPATNAPNTSQGEPTEVKVEDEFEDFTKIEHEVDSIDSTSFLESSISDIKEDESITVNVSIDVGKKQECYVADPSAKTSIKPREDPSMLSSTKEINQEIKVKDFSLLQESTLLNRSIGILKNNIIIEDSSGEKNKENLTKSLRSRDIELSQDKVKQNECMPHKCSHCYKIFSTNNRLVQHMRNHTGKAKKKFNCNNCGKTFLRSNALKTHMITHIGKKLYYCSKCDLEFSRNEDLLQHTKSHSSERSYQLPQNEETVDVEMKFQCIMCNKLFLHASIFKNHMNTHTKKKPYNFCDDNMVLHHNESNPDKMLYKCNKCNKAFSENQDLEYHMMTHTEEKKHQCNKCNKSYSHAGTLKSHMRAHINKTKTHVPYKCKYCEKTFISRSNLSVHILKHHTYACRLCDKAFSLNSALRCHMRTDHIGDMRLHSLQL